MSLRTLHYPREKALYLLLNIIAHDVIHDYGSSGNTDKRWEPNIATIRQFSREYRSATFGLAGGGKGRSSTHTIVINNKKRNNESTIHKDKHRIATLKREFSRNKKIDIKHVPRTGSKIATLSRQNSKQVSIRRFPGTGMRIATLTRDGSRRKKTIVTPFSGIGVRLGRDDNYINYLNALDEIKNDINNYIIFTFFNHFLYNWKETEETTIEYIDSDYYIIPYDTDIEDEDYKDIFHDMSNKFIGYCAINREIPERLHYTDFLDILCYFLSNTKSTIQSILENITDDPIILPTTSAMSESNSSDDSKNKKGGKKEARRNYDLSVEESRDLISEIDILLINDEITRYLTRLKDIYQIFLENKGELSEGEKQEYQSLKRDILTRFKDVFLRFGEHKKAGCIDGNVDLLPEIKRFGRSSYELSDVDIIFNQNIQTMLSSYKGIIKKAEKEASTVKERQEREQKALSSGKLTEADKRVREQFTTFIAKSGLFLTGVCDRDGVINSELNSYTIDPALNTEINILLYQAGWTRNIGWQQVTRADLDSILINYFDDIIPEISGRFVCHRSNNYVINNAASVENALKKKIFCPYTSILDGMSQCSWKTSQGNRERGNMNFKIMDDDDTIFYHGRLELMDSDVRTSFRVKVNDLITFHGDKQVNLKNGIELEAPVVLKNTLVNIIRHIIDGDTPDVYFRGDNIFDNLFYIFADAVRSNLFNIVYQEILFKGTGDLFQEINSVCKFGGYTMDNYYADSEIAHINRLSGDQLRFFAAYDRPSGTRFIYMLKHGRLDEINIKAVGGYYSENKLVLFKRDENKNICGTSSTGGKFIKKNRKTRKLINKLRLNKYKSRKNN